ncbi:MAG: CRISPR-associated endonuclease Cas1, partial [Oscillospiraceae bacterium]|nr:CRISPR-associated endonuclease Cas1 [Oscillospiraceae bacterium]
MKKLLNTLFVTTPACYLALENETVVVCKEDETLLRLPLLNLEGIVTFGYTGASPALMGACAKRGVALTFLTPSGRFLARVEGQSRGNVTLRKEQYRVSDDVRRSCAYARGFIIGKLYNSKWILERAARDYPQRLEIHRLKTAAAQIGAALELARNCTDLEQLRGVEGSAATAYFGEMDQLILQQKADFQF